MIRFFVACALESTAEAAGLAAQPAVGRWRSAGGRGFRADEIALDIDVADLASSLTKPLEQAQGFVFLLGVRRKAGEHGEQSELGFDAAGRSA